MVLLECKSFYQLCLWPFYSQGRILHLKFGLLFGTKKYYVGQWAEVLCAEERVRSEYFPVDRLFVPPLLRKTIKVWRGERRKGIFVGAFFAEQTFVLFKGTKPAW